MKLHKSVTFLPFLLSFLMISLYNFNYIFTLRHCSAICWDFILRLICLDMCIILFLLVLLLFRLWRWSIWDRCNVWKGAFYVNYLRIPVVYFCSRGVCMGSFSSLRFTFSFYIFLVQIILWSVRKYLSVRACVVEKPVNWLALAGVCMIRVAAKRYCWKDFSWNFNYSILTNSSIVNVNKFKWGFFNLFLWQFVNSIWQF